MTSEQKNILLTNDDGINSVGIWAAAEALAPLGKVWVVAPRTQATSFGRSNPVSSDGIIEEITREVNGVTWHGYAAGASPAQCVLFSVEEVLPVRPDLVVSGINFGANTGVDITRSGTIGAALEAANYGIPAMAVSLETAAENTFLHNFDADFSVAAYFTGLFARALLETKFAPDVQVLKVEVPIGATRSTPWHITRLAPMSLYLPVFSPRKTLLEKSQMQWRLQPDFSIFPEGTDSHTVFVKREVAVTPLSMDMTSRVPLADLEDQLRCGPDFTGI